MNLALSVFVGQHTKPGYTKRATIILWQGHVSSGDSTQLLHLHSRYYSAQSGRFLTRDTWGGDADLPMSYNKWLFAYANAIKFTDPTGMYPVSACEHVSISEKEACLLGSGPLNDPPRAHLIQQNLWSMRNYTSATKKDFPQNWNVFLEEYGTRWNAWLKDHCDIWWLAMPDKSPLEIVLGIFFQKEMRFVASDPNKKYMVELLARQYWEECGTGYCGVSVNWTASNSLLNVLDYSESMTKLTPLDIDLVFAYQDWNGQPSTAPTWNAAIELASRVIDGSEGTAGKDNNRPYEVFCTDCTNGESPDWLVRWLYKHYRDFRESADHYGRKRVVYIYGQRGTPNKGTYSVVLTPNQMLDLCGYSKCINPDLPEPAWVQEDLKGLK